MDGILTEWSSTDSRPSDHTNALSFKHQHSKVPAVLSVKTRSASGMPLRRTLSASESVSERVSSSVTEALNDQFFWSLKARTISFRNSVEPSPNRVLLKVISGAHVKSSVSSAYIQVMCKSQMRFSPLHT